MNINKSILEKNTLPNVGYTYNVLVVEDDDVSYLLLSEILSSYPLKLIRANDGEEAVSYFNKDQSNINLVLMDIKLPKISGYDATQRIKAINPSIPIIAVTAYAHSQGIIDCYNSGCDDFIAKPFDIKKMIRLIENYLVLRN